MKKMNIFKVLMSLTLALVSYGVIAQTVPVTTTTTVTDVGNYVELQTGSGDDWSGGALAIGGYTNYFTVSGNPSLMTYDGTQADPGTAYTDAGATAITHVVPVVVVPDQDLNPSTFAWNGAGSDDLNYANMTDNAIWTWALTGATSASLTNVSDALPGGFTAGGGALRDAAHFNQRYLSTGSDVETFTVDVYESSVNAAGDATLCDDGPENMDISIVDFPSVALNTAGDAQQCWNSDGTTYTLTLDLSGTPPFFIGLDYTITPDGGAATYEFVENLTAGTGGGADGNNALGTGGAGANNIIGSLNDAGDGDALTWQYVIVFEQDPGADGVAGTSNEINLSGGVKTTHALTVRFVNDLYSRKSDRQGTIGDPSNIGELTSHVLYSAPANVDMSVELFPVPTTGNIFTLPN